MVQIDIKYLVDPSQKDPTFGTRKMKNAFLIENCIVKNIFFKTKNDFGLVNLIEALLLLKVFSNSKQKSF